MRHISDHLQRFGRIRRGSLEDNEMLHKNFKEAYKNTNKRITMIDPKSVLFSVCDIQHLELKRADFSHSDPNIRLIYVGVKSNESYSAMKSQGIDFINITSGKHVTMHKLNIVLGQTKNSVHHFQRFKKVKFSHLVPVIRH